MGVGIVAPATGGGGGGIEDPDGDDDDDDWAIGGGMDDLDDGCRADDAIGGGIDDLPEAPIGGARVPFALVFVLEVELSDEVGEGAGLEPEEGEIGGFEPEGAVVVAAVVEELPFDEVDDFDHHFNFESLEVERSVSDDLEPVERSSPVNDVEEFCLEGFLLRAFLTSLFGAKSAGVALR